MKEFKNLYNISKTLRFELRPYGETAFHIKEAGILERDCQKASHRRKMQELIDEKYKTIIEEQLSSLELKEEDLRNSVSKEKKIKDDAIKSLKKEIINKFSKVSFKEGDFITNLRKEQPENETISMFKGFTTYFTNFFDIRKHVFTGDSSGSIAFRLIDDNLKIFCDNLKKISKFPEDLKSEITGLDNISSIESYNKFLSQAGISKYNEILGGVSLEGDIKEQGINEKINLYCQKNKVKLPRLNPLYKMILSDRTSSSFVLDIIENDNDLIELIQTFLDELKISSDIKLSNNEHIYIKYKEVGNLPQVFYHNFMNALKNSYDSENLKTKLTKKYEEKRKKFIESKKYSIKEISQLTGESLEPTSQPIENSSEPTLSERLENKYRELFEIFKEEKEKFLNIKWNVEKNIKQSEHKKIIKNLLDSLKAIQGFYSYFELVDEDKNPDVMFYNWLHDNMIQLNYEFNGVYNRVRNYLTKKEYSTVKFKLNFDNSTLAKGWDANMEIKNSAFIMRKFNEFRDDYDYYLGIWKKDLKPKQKINKLDCHGQFEKMKYKQYTNPSRDLPGQFVSSKKWNEVYPLDPEFLNKYEKGYHKKGDNFDKAFLHELIDRYKHGLKNHENKYMDEYNFKLRETKDYNEYSEFIKDVSMNNYKVSFEKIEDITNLVKEGKLYVFQIYSKDFSKYSKGTKNLNTIYFESLFSEENLKEYLFKLSGEAELFYRPATLKYDEKTRKLGHHHEELKNKFAYPIIKDKRYSEDKYFFHVPIVINKNADNNRPEVLNELIKTNIDKFTHIIGIDRGERHLIYISVVEIATGKIVEQKHLDDIVNKDTKGKPHKTSYLKKLEEKSTNRNNERKSWDTIETIKELKEGYISQVVNEIRNLQEKYNGLIVLENLNYGFKNSRIKVEKQIYQKFEIALIKKFNYLIDKKDPKTYLHGKQLTNTITTLDEIRDQSGIVFYIPAWNTSKIDPVTGFVNLFYADDLRYKNQEAAQDFIDKIDKIYYENGVFKFDIDFSKWNKRYEKSKREWTITSYGTRINTFRNPQKNNQWDYKEVDLTKEFEMILNRDGKLKTENVSNYKNFMYLFKLIVSMRNSNPLTGEDYILSPVADASGKHFDSRDELKNLPTDADANGAFNIARKGIMAIEKIKENNKKPFDISNEDYLRYIQKI